MPRTPPKKKPLEGGQIEAIRRGNHGKHQGLIDKLLFTIDALRAERAALEGQIAADAEKPAAVDREAAKASFLGRNRVLVVLGWDGFCQAYAEKNVEVKLLALKPGQDEEKAVAELPQCYRDVYWPINLRGQSMPNYLLYPNRVTMSMDAEQAIKNAIKYADNDQLLRAVEEVRQVRDMLTR